jgi:hypothetical protein
VPPELQSLDLLGAFLQMAAKLEKAAKKNVAGEIRMYVTERQQQLRGAPQAGKPRVLLTTSYYLLLPPPQPLHRRERRS